MSAYALHPMLSMDRWWVKVSPERRLDRNAGNMAMLVGLMTPTLSIILRGPTPNSALNDMPDGIQIWMCAFIFGGCGLKLFGALSGFPWFRPKAKLKDCYKWGFVGAPMATAGALVYGWYILSATENLWSALSGISTPCFGVGISIQAFIYWLEWRRIDHAEETLIAEAKTEVKARSDDTDTMG